MTSSEEAQRFRACSKEAKAMESALPSKKVVVSMVRRVPSNTSALGAGAPEVTMSANACSPSWLRSLEHFLPSLW